MQIGVVYPQSELGGDPGAVRQFGKAIEDLGFDYLLAYDHVLGALTAIGVRTACVGLPVLSMRRRRL